MESLEDFRRRARAWIEANLERRDPRRPLRTREENAALQAKLFDAGFTGFAVPKEYAGQGLSLDHQAVWVEEAGDYVTPQGYQVSIGMMMPTLLDLATEAVKKRHIPRMLRGEELFMQLLSEPSGGSDMAGALTRATKRGDSYFISGSKMWSSGALNAHYGLCLARVNWDVPKHAGLGMFVLPLKAKGVTIQGIRPATGEEAHFCIEYFDDVEIPAEYVLGGECEGWASAQRLLFHERNAVAGIGFGLGYQTSGERQAGGGWRADLVSLARKHQVLHDPALAAQIADNHIDSVVGGQLSARVNTGLVSGKLKGQWGSLVKLNQGLDLPGNAELGLSVAGADGVIWSGNAPGGETTNTWLRYRGNTIAGGSNEIQRNIVSERLLGLPREPADDRDVPFNELMKRRQQRQS
ncbi:MAG: acyl-CoA dehydrogenase family protein [Caulobacteraceae bacterium]|nr:acyl-CoA dehydrogenase family protein [Caulobacteraceae bacterium]